MKPRDPNLELMTLPELRTERLALLDKVRTDKATVKDARRFSLLSGLIVMFENAKILAGPVCKKSDFPTSRILPKNKAGVGPAFVPADCDECKSARATIFMTDVLAGKLHKSNLCECCAERKAQEEGPLGILEQLKSA